MARKDLFASVSNTSRKTRPSDILRDGGVSSFGIWSCVPRVDATIAKSMTPAEIQP
jgi:hypothetical protein